MQRKKLPVGIEDFEEIRKEGADAFTSGVFVLMIGK